jgi:hypothetical protein
MPKKYYCYVDESGQDTKGELFIVSVIVEGEERNEINNLCEEIERETKKGSTKWIKSRDESNFAYMDCILREMHFLGSLNYSVFEGRTDYPQMTIEAITRTIQLIREHRITILIDALPRSSETKIGVTLRRMGYKTRKVRGVRKEENDALIRLADALCGLVRESLRGNKKACGLLNRGIKSGHIRKM